MNRCLYLLSTVILFCTLSTNALAATIADTYGLSPKGLSMGNAMTAHVDDWSSVYYNIAGLGRTTQLKDKPSKNELFLGYLNTQPQTDLDIPQRYEETGGVRTDFATNADKDLDFGSLIVGAALDLNMLYKMPRAISSSRFGIAVAVGDDLSVAKVNDVEPQTHNYLRFGREAQQMMLISGLGLGFIDDAFGIGLGLKSSFGGETRILLEDVEVGTDPQRPRQQNTMDLKLESSLVAGLYVDFGKIAQPLEGLNLGLSYREESRFKIDPLTNISVVKVGGVPLNLALSILDYYQPSSYTAGISYKFAGKLLLALDVELQTWSNYEVSSNQMVNDGSVLPELDDIWIPKIGLQYDLNPRARLYFGYYYQPTFVPDQANKGEVNWLDNDKHVASIGISYDVGKWAGFQKSMILHAGYQFQYLVDRDVVKTNPTTLNPSYSYGGTVHTVVVGLSF